MSTCKDCKRPCFRGYRAPGTTSALTIDELRFTRGGPVWIIDREEPRDMGWALCQFKIEKIKYDWYFGISEFEIENYQYEYFLAVFSDGTAVRLRPDTYGTAWIAYMCPEDARMNGEDTGE